MYRSAGHPGRRQFAVDIADSARGPAGRAAGMSTEPDAAPLRAVNPLSAIALAVVATLGALYIVSQFLRNSVGVIAPNLAAEMGLTPVELGLLSGIYFFVFAATQIPLGVALDRFGPKLCMLICIAFTVLGCALFAAAKSSGKVWVNLDSKVYHKGGRWYGKTKTGKFMTEDEAKAAGYKASQTE